MNIQQQSPDIRNYCLNKEYFIMLFKLLHDVTQCLNKHNIRYWADGGTLLGIIRNEGQIPWDDDLDIGVMNTDFTRVLKIVNELNNNYKTEVYQGIVKVFIPNKWAYTEHRFYGTPTIDIFSYKKTNNNTIVLADNGMRLKFNNARYTADELFPLKNAKYGSMDVSVPHNPYPYLERLYGNKWNDEYIVEVREKPVEGQVNVKNRKLLFDKSYNFVKELQ